MALKPLSQLPETPLKIKRALLSVSDKSGIVELAKMLHQNGVEILSTGGTANVIRKAEIPVKDVSDVTQFPECLDGRVKTLHPNIHGGILARTSHEPDNQELKKLDIKPIELVVVNLYPFKKTIKKADITPAEATENIDIGGPTMVRAAAKNFAHVCILTNPGQYNSFVEELNKKSAISFSTRRKLARKAFEHTADYDAAISNYFTQIDEQALPEQLNVSHTKSADLRYGENPHQKAGIYGEQQKYIDCFHGKELSYNNYLDIDSALNLMADFQNDDPTIAIFKHTVPCGVATDDHLTKAYRKAFETDKMSPFGGIVISNKKLDLETAQAIDEIFTEIILAPSFSDEALDLLTQKKNRRLVRILQFPEADTLTVKSVFGGALVQQPDSETVEAGDLKTVTERKPTDIEMADMLFAWKVVKHVKSNAIVYAKNRQTLGIGTGQTSRVDSSEIAVNKAQKEKLDLKGSAIASDAFFPFADGVEAAAKAGATAVIQPGGSIRDEEVIQEANKSEMTMIFTGKRHFKH
ncbi:bifunctional phosphoribosylaminoimidazolecarboxamide formyltransferase/IMP cyclohydrolase [Rhodohalobacter sp.]|uniref:bifunctional phosphoribosylaminoimidazolecarboxamide formyltransferase/IMP cyclohydrolase n=1 Tax=Rhodohalobacter sp. TaxID=1974210 RepID=UPI002ACD3248|nr:bifunctional phosphoribosylaminoimidazolecarboxamide formyltransferase/IMP cyclohydrolase [Rhodohalobacter sp.]MDZ7756684.1 bifunctional phosphoribosylaminoimidazolecarboxamide formyltransferase/IMP cyclohydrolase [Rhodohalobacter sp.]